MTPSGSTSFFHRFAGKAARLAGHPTAFIAAVAMVVLWAIAGPLFGYSNTWQLLINTVTTVITLLMVFLIQNTQYRDAVAIQIKLDELIRAIDGAHNALLDLEELDEKELNSIRESYEHLAAEARKRLKAGRRDTDVPGADGEEEAAPRRRRPHSSRTRT